MIVDPPAQPATEAGVERCRNCGAALTGRYCADCGQAADVHMPTTLELVHQALEGITHSDSRLWSTLFLLWFKPGKLTLEFVAGRRARYLPPFRLYLVLSVIFFLLASISPMQIKFVRFDDPRAATVTSYPDCGKPSVILFGRDLSARIQRACAETARDNGRNLLHIGLATLPKAMFIFLPLIAFLNMLLYWRPRRPYAEQLTFFLHLQAFFFSAMTLVILAGDAAGARPGSGVLSWVATLLLWSLPLYTMLAIKRAFAQSWARTLIKTAALFAVYLVVLSITLTGVFVYAMLQL
jgi:Protein of unknown function (DUF3667)